MRLNDLVDAVHERGHTHGDLLRLGELEGPPGGGRDDLVQAISDVLFLPEIYLNMLDPCEIRDDHASGMRKHVRDAKRAVLLQVALARLNLRYCIASRITSATPRPVASSRPSLPPIARGLPVTTPGTAYPTCWL